MKTILMTTGDYDSCIHEGLIEAPDDLDLNAAMLEFEVDFGVRLPHHDEKDYEPGYTERFWCDVADARNRMCDRGIFPAEWRSDAATHYDMGRCFVAWLCHLKGCRRVEYTEFDYGQFNEARRTKSIDGNRGGGGGGAGP